MNEVTTIHLGRQSYTIAVDAQKALRAYLDAIHTSVRDQEVVDEVELRMAELLNEHGVNGDKVILIQDVDFLKEQLGDPKDFNSDDDEAPAEKPVTEGKRLFRDTESGILAGVASGLSKYFGIDVWIIRIIFIIGTFTGGWGVLPYIVLWLVVPEAKSSSDRLQMAGKPVTVQSLKEVVARADVPGATKRAHDSLAGPARSVVDIILKVIGLIVIFSGLALIFALVVSESYLLVHNGSLVTDNLFPIGFREHLLIHLGVGTAALIAVFTVLIGLAIFKQKWPVRSWVTGTLLGLIFIGLASSIALAVDAAPRVQDRYNANVHTTVRILPPFTSVKTLGDSDSENAVVQFQTGNSYDVSLRYFDNPDLSKVTTKVENGKLVIDTRPLTNDRHCNGICIPALTDVKVIVEAPTSVPMDMPDMPLPAKPQPPQPLKTF
jgi:phage shock protein PspC (stress-responsive transcriptional regulator)